RPKSLGDGSESDYHSRCSSSMAEEKPHGGLKFWQFMVAGSVAGSVEHMAMFPVDTIKTRMQAITAASPSKAAVRPPSLLSIIKFEGFGVLYRGILAMALGAGPAHAVYFSVYETFKRILSRNEGGGGGSSLSHAVSGVAATVASDAVITPMDVVKQRLQLKGSPYRGVRDCVRRVATEEGVGGFYASYKTTVVMNAPFTAVHFAAYEAAKKALAADGADDGLAVHATAGAAAGALAAAVTTPLDVVKTQLQCQGVCGCEEYSSMGEVVRRVVRREGFRGLMRGWAPRTMFHAPAAAICWSTYEAIKAAF
ncbi:hypothetical protein M569_01508, partial [Genlisea aurea]